MRDLWPLMGLRQPRMAVAMLAAGLIGCDASFVSEQATNPDRGPSTVRQDTGGSVVSDAGGSDSATTDSAATGQDSGATVGAGVFARGSFEGLSGYKGEGTAELVRTSSGAIEVHFSSDFSTSSIPGPVIVLTERATLDTIDPAKGDIHLGALLPPFSGRKTFEVPQDAGQRRYVFVYCEPFNIQTARAKLEDVQ